METFSQILYPDIATYILGRTCPSLLLTIFCRLAALDAERSSGGPPFLHIIARVNRVNG